MKNNQKIEDIVEQIHDLESFKGFIKKLQNDYITHADEWENTDLSNFLEGLAGFTGSIDGYYKNFGIDMKNISPWRMFADMLLAARVYE